MNKGWIIGLAIVILIIIGIVLANQNINIKSLIPFIKCDPNWILLSDYILNEEYCKSSCYHHFQTNHFRAEPLTNDTSIVKCYCDVNKCS